MPNSFIVTVYDPTSVNCLKHYFGSYSPKVVKAKSVKCFISLIPDGVCLVAVFDDGRIENGWSDVVVVVGQVGKEDDVAKHFHQKESDSDQRNVHYNVFAFLRCVWGWQYIILKENIIGLLESLKPNQI